MTIHGNFTYYVSATVVVVGFGVFCWLVCECFTALLRKERPSAESDYLCVKLL